MDKKELQALLARIDGAGDLDAPLLQDAATTLRQVFPNAPAHPESLGEPTEAVLHLIDRCLPGWTISLRGEATEPDGHWRCSLRESGARDNDEVIGAGAAPTVSLALLEALVRAAIAKTQA